MSAIIEVKDLSKCYTIRHEGVQRYTALRDVMATKAKKLFSFPKSLRSSLAPTTTKEEFWALKDVSFNIEQGDRVGIIGRNGAGKSTLLKILSRITEPTSGGIKIRGRVASLLEVGTGFHPELTGRENIFLNGAILGMSRAEIRKHFDAIVDFAEIEKFLDTPVKRYSSGMYVRLAFAVAAHLEPEILVVDEVLAVGDTQFQKKCLGKMEDVSKNEGRTVLFVSHNMGVINQLCNEGILLRLGEVNFKGIANEAINYYFKLDRNSDNYIANATVSKKKINYIENISVVNDNYIPSSSFSFNENILIHFKCMVKNYSPNLLVGIAMQDKFNNRVFTVLKEIQYFKISNVDKIEGYLVLPNRLFAPNHYSFVFALWAKNGEVHDNVDGVCQIKIHDDGTDLANYEGDDYGNVIIKPEWIKATENVK